MARECDRRDTAVQPDCPRKCLLRRDAAGDDPAGERGPAREQVEWAGLPVNLDLVFSQKQRDRVYVQHLMRQRENRLWRWQTHDTRSCVCDSADRDRVDLDAAKSLSSR